ncbi:hypothetical protein EQG49_00480 [Periweissella cryptocerci]|uniref:Uncharacterized protein n=1 Tax=Periweissella cryptocerci TaxID=2506420 RepID=A0A4P6YQY9_9LACO|nr:hypothetical protein [Periweissella cryptocerci]QBO35030.1 hypothetical protein EQG49_00480 [Periweissella cryptocerci]
MTQYELEYGIRIHHTDQIPGFPNNWDSADWYRSKELRDATYEAYLKLEQPADKLYDIKSYFKITR